LSDVTRALTMSLRIRPSGFLELAGPPFDLPRQTRSRTSTRPDHRFLPLSAPDLDDDDLAELTETLRAGRLSAGSKVHQFEQEFAKLVGVKHVIAVNNGTTAFRLTLQTLDLNAGDEVILSPFAPVAAAELVRAAGAVPRFVDVTDRGLHLSLEQLPAAITERTRAILVSHVSGLPAEMDEIRAIAQRHRLTIIEDAAQALPATYRHQMVGGLGDVACFTFFAQRAMSLGEGGAICTNDAAVASRIRVLAISPWSLVMSRVDLRHLNPDEFDPTTTPNVQADGYQSSITELTAAIGLAQLRKASTMWQRRREIAATYNSTFSRFVELQCPADRADSQHAWHLYLLRINPQRLRISRNEFLSELRARNIGASVLPPPLHLQAVYREHFGYQPESCPVATREYAREISLPIYNRMSDDDVRRVIEAVEGIVRRSCAMPNQSR
jgi:dTDP-4-amino-4,6-dideoxygalactose transaminase